MKPFQVNCSDLIADFNIHEDEEIREILELLTSEYNVELYFETTVRKKEFFFGENSSFNAEIEGIAFVVTVVTDKACEYWTAKLVNEKDTERLINGIEKIIAKIYGGESEFASNYFVRQLNNYIITLLPNYHSEIENGLIDQININEVFKVEVKVGSGENVTTLCYNNNCYDYTLGWYFDGEHFDHKNYPFYEWAERNCNAKIRPFDGGSSYGYMEYSENPEKERLRKRI